MDVQTTLDPVTALGFVVAFFLLSYATGWINKGLDWLFAKLWQLLVRSEHEGVAYLHYMYRAARQGHKPPHPVDCNDGDCVKIDH